MMEFEKMTLGLDFDSSSSEFDFFRKKAFSLLQKINHCQHDTVRAYFLELFAQFGEGSSIRVPFSCEYGKTISIGKNTFINMGVIMLDNAPITIGDNVMIGPNAQFYTPSHSLNHLERRNWKIHSLPIVVEDDVWIGGNVVIGQGVTIGARSVIAAGSVVMQDVAPDTLVGGTPARLIRKLSE